MHVIRTQIVVYDTKARENRSVTVQVAVDEFAIAQALGAKAFTSKRHTSKALHGAVEVSIK